MQNKNIFFPEICPHCGHKNKKNKWCYETIGEDGVIYGYCNRQAEPAVGWKATKDTDKNGITKYVYQESLPEQTYSGKPRTTYYTYNKGDKPILRVKRVDSKEGKQITQEKYQDGKWVSGGLPNEEIPLYRYNELDFTRAIFIVEGEKVADKLWELGLQATTNIGGSKKWRDSHTESLKHAKKIIICPDRDKVGIEHADKIYEFFPEAQWLYAFPDSPYWRLNVPENKGVDLFDYIQANNLTKENLISEIKDSPIHKIITDIPVENKVSPLNELVTFIRDKFKTLGDLEQADLIEISQKTGISFALVSSIYKEEADKITIQETLPQTDISKLFEYQSKQICLSDLISDEKLCLKLKEYCEVNRVDEVLLVMSLLPLIGAELGSRIKIAPKSTWIEYPCFWSVTVAPPSSNKSVVQKHIYKVTKKRDAENEERDKQNREALKKVQRAWDKMSQTQQEANSENPEVNPELYEAQFCKPPRLSILQSCSSESLWKRISEQPTNAGIVWCWDEIAGLLEGLDKYSKGSDTRPLLLSAWSSTMENMSVQRVDRANSFRLGEQTLSITGNIQPDLFPKHFKLNGDKDGFVSRWLYAIPKKHPKFAKYTNRSVDLQPTFKELFPKLEELPETIIAFSAEAHGLWTQVWERYHLEIEKVLYSNPIFSQYIAKMLSYVLRLSLVIHTLDVVSGVASDLTVCSKSALERAIRMGSYFLGQFRLLQMSDKTSNKDEILKSFNLDKTLLDIITYIKQETKDNTAAIRDITRKFSGRQVNNVKLNVEIVTELLQHLSELGFGKFSQDNKEFTLSEPTIEDINQSTKADEPIQPLEAKFKKGDLVCIIGNEKFDGYTVTLEECTPLSATFINPLTQNLETVSVDYLELYTPKIQEECYEICEKLRKVTNKEQTLRVIYSHSRYFKVAFTCFLEPEFKEAIEQFL